MVIVLELENIGGFAGKHRFEFREGLNEIIAPNATGKTSLIKALLAMYVPNITSAEEILNYDADEGYIKVEIDGKTFIRRFRREKGKVLEAESKPIVIDDRIKYLVLDVQLGEVVKNIVLEMKPDITNYLVRVFKLKDYEDKIAELRSRIQSKEREAEYLKKEVAELTEVDEERKRLEEERTKLEKELESIRGISIERARQIQDRIGELNRRLGEIEIRIKDIEERLLPAIEERTKELQLEIERLKKDISEFYERYREPDKYMNNIKEHIDRIDKFIDKLKRELSDLISGHDARISVIKMATLTKTTTCPVCGRSIELSPEEFWSSRLREVEDEVKKIKENLIKDYEERINKAQEERLKSWKELEEFTKKYNEIREIEIVRLPKYESELKNLTKEFENYKNEALRLRSEKNYVIKLLEDLEKELSEEERKAAEKRAEIEKRLGEIEQRIKDLEEVIAEKSDAGKKLTETIKEIEELKGELKRTEEELYTTLAMMKDEFTKISSEVIKELGFTWLKTIRLVSSEVRDKTGEVKRVFEIKVIRILPSGKEIEQPLSTLSTSERLAVSLITILTGYRLKVLEEYEGKVPIIADEALLAFDPYRFAKVAEELKKYAKYIIITRLAEPNKVSQLTVLHRQ
jgi:DNA repair exonuclease SbcCD ATPase subunit